MKTITNVQTRRDRCYVFARRAARLTPHQSANAWFAFTERLEELGAADMPKFADILTAFRAATVRGLKLSGKKRDVDLNIDLNGLQYALDITRGRRILNRPPAYLAAIDEIEIFLMAAIERVQNGEPMSAQNVVTTKS